MYERQFLIALGLTVATETSVLLAAMRLLWTDGKARPAWRILAAGFLCSTTTLPYLWFILPRFIGSYEWLAVIGETGVTAVEAVILHLVLDLGFRRAVVLSIACNLVSFTLGLLVF